MTCPSCGTAAPAGARYCAACGHGLSDGRGDERRLVTVLFADLVGYTTLAETRDPEQVKTLVDRCFERLAGDVVSCGGRVDKIVGDAVMALFGAPQAHEDDAERAVRAGLQMQRTLGQYAEELGVDLRIRVGINSGEVLVGALRAGGDYTAMGDVVNTASRLQTAAQPGQVLVGPTTHAATREVIRYENLGPLRARGREEPVPAWVAHEALVPPGHRPRRLRTPLVGRSAEIGLLRHALAVTSERRRAHLVVLTGDAGAGKTRLAEEVATVARAEHHGYVLEGRCVPYGESNVWWPLAEALRRACGITPTDDHSAAKAKGLRAVSTMLDLDPGDKEVKRVLRGLVYLMEQDELGELEPARARDEAVRSLAVALERLTVHRPLVFIVSELHWADDLLLEFLDRLLDRVQHLPVLLVATARPELADRWHPPAGRHNQLVLHVDPLDTAATEDLLVTLLEGAVPAHLHHALVERSGGNPLFLEELVALVGGDQPVGDLPVTLRGLVAARLDALGPSERGTLEDAAVVGRIGTPEALVAMAGPGRQAEVEAALAMLAADDFLALGESRTDGREWEFRSELVREVAYAILSKSERARRHAALADWLATRAGERPGAADVDELAHHYGAAADIAIELGGVEGVAVDIAAKAARWLEEAAGRAQAEELWLGASGLLDQAMRLAPATDTAMRERLLLARARARLGRREAEGARADITEALAAARSRGDDAAEIQGLVLTGELERIEGRLGDSAATLNRAVRLARQIGDDQAIADAMRTLGQTLLFTGDDIGADVASQEALRAYRILGDRRGEAWALQSLAWTAFMRGDLVPAEERLAESAAAFSEIGDWGGHAWAQGLLAWVRFSEGRLDDAEALAHSIAKETGESGDRWAMGMMTVLRASVDLWKGRSHSAVERAQRAQQLFVEVRDSWGETQSLVPLIRGLLALGEIDAARSLLRDLTDRARDVSDVRMRRLAEGAVVIAITQQLGEGPALGDLARRVVEDRPHEATPEQRAIRGLGLLQAGEVESAVDVLEEAAGFDEGPETSANIGPMFAFALLAAGRLDDADRVLAASAPPGEGTYADQVWAGIARAFLLHRQGHSSASGSPLAPVAGVGSAAALALAEAEAVADGTQDRLAQATVRLARARLLRAAGAPEADEAAARASDRLGALGVDLAGWVRVFDLAAARSPHAASGAV